MNAGRTFHTGNCLPLSTSLTSAATTSNAIDTKTKELMAVAIGVVIHCDGCIAYHTKMAHQHGATKQEFLETVSLAVYMGGGPAAVYMVPMRCAHMINSQDNRRVSDNMAGHDNQFEWPAFLRRAPRHLFFTGKGGVGKTSLACEAQGDVATGSDRDRKAVGGPASRVPQLGAATAV